MQDTTAHSVPLILVTPPRRNMMTGVQSAGHDVLGGIGVDDDGPATRPQDNGAAETLPGPPPKLTQADRERMLKEQQKRVKKAKKEAKKVLQSVCCSKCIRCVLSTVW